VLGVVLLSVDSQTSKTAATTEAPHDDAEEPHEEDAEAADGADEEEADADERTEDETEESDQESVWTEETISSEQIHRVHKRIDANSDGKVSMGEIVTFSQAFRNAAIVKEALASFHQLDSNKDAKLSQTEWLAHNFGESDEEDEEDVEAASAPSSSSDQDNENKERLLEIAKFKAADANADGFLDEAELPAAFYPELSDRMLDITAAHELKEKDKDKNGELTPLEFWENAEEDQDGPVVAQQMADFAKLDADHNGKLNLQELKHWESGAFHTHDAMTQLFQVADENSDQHVTAAELDNARTVMANTQATSQFVEWAEHSEL